ncbi:MAG: iron-siderophore ABC transporter substrate-binding protein [Leptolyngbya sp. IPPAS B-1204]|nr:MAG: iron-siderophore ABC transporter substrate-binding protein [Leptolyngbya sp. IPPAS B-1204]
MTISLHRLTHLILLSILTIILASACNTITTDTNINSNNQPLKDCRTVQHVMGSTCIPRNPQRVVNLAADTASIWALGISPIASTYTPDSPTPKYLQGKVDRVESVGDYKNPNLEKILRLQPDLIIYDSQYKSQLHEIYKRLSHIAPTVVLNTPFPPPSWIAMFEELAQMLDKEEMSQQLIEQYWKRVEKLKQALGERRHTLQISVASTNSQEIWAYGEKHFSGTVLSDIGLQRPSAQRGDFFYIGNISKEKISHIDGDILFFLTWDSEDDVEALEKLRQESLWQQLNVVQRNQVYFVGEHWHNPDVFAINAVLDDIEKYLVDTP